MKIIVLLSFTLLSSVALAQNCHPSAVTGESCAPPAAVSEESPFDPSCNGTQLGTNYHNAPVEPWVAVDPKNPQHIVGAWQQDRWADGGSSGLVNGVSFDGGRTWTMSFAQFSMCSGGTYQRASDPWVTFAPDGTVHQISLSVSNYGLNGPNTQSAVLASKSTDGGLTWSAPITLQSDGPTAFNDKESITADPFDSHYVYAVWDRSTGSTSTTYHQPVWFSRSTDGGASWEPAHPIFDPGVDSATIGNIIVVLPDGSLVDVFRAEINVDSRTTSQTFVEVIRSTDRGVTWTGPFVISTNSLANLVDVKTNKSIRAGTLPAITVDRNSGALYASFEDSRFSNHLRNGIAFSKSTDGGKTWSPLAQVNRAPTVQAFASALAVAPDGTVALDYLDFRKDNDDPTVLLTTGWRILSHDGGNTWQEFPLVPAFNLLNAPQLAGYFVGDYHSIAATATGFVSFVVVANPQGSPQQNTVLSVTSVEPGDVSTTSREQSHHSRHVAHFKQLPPVAALLVSALLH
jgi:hypothetical protein